MGCSGLCVWLLGSWLFLALYSYAQIVPVLFSIEEKTQTNQDCKHLARAFSHAEEKHDPYSGVTEHIRVDPTEYSPHCTAGGSVSELLLFACHRVLPSPQGVLVSIRAFSTPRPRFRLLLSHRKRSRRRAAKRTNSPKKSRAERYDEKSNRAHRTQSITARRRINP